MRFSLGGIICNIKVCTSVLSLGPLVLFWSALFQTTLAQVKDHDLSKAWVKDELPFEQADLSAKVMDKKLFPGGMKPRNFLQMPIDLSSQKVIMEKEFRSRILELGFSRLIGQKKIELGLSTDTRFERLKWMDNLLHLGVSAHFEVDKRWTAHLQKADFEWLIGQISLNDINRYQFRKNRENEETIPVKKPGGNTLEFGGDL